MAPVRPVDPVRPVYPVRPAQGEGMSACSLCPKEYRKASEQEKGAGVREGSRQRCSTFDESVSSVAPVRPVDIVAPVRPVAPLRPVAPVRPVDPVRPATTPVRPVHPVRPVAPVRPANQGVSQLRCGGNPLPGDAAHLSDRACLCIMQAWQARTKADEAFCSKRGGLAGAD